MTKILKHIFHTIRLTYKAVTIGFSAFTRPPARYSRNNNATSYSAVPAE